MNYLIHGDNFLCTQSVAYYDSSNSEKLVETMSNMIYRGLDGWRDIFIKDTTKEQARDVLLALLKEQESEVSMLAKARQVRNMQAFLWILSRMPIGHLQLITV